MRLAMRTFWLSFVPAAIFLVGCFACVERLVVTAVSVALRDSLRASQLAITRTGAADAARNRRSLMAAGENSALKAGIQLMLSEGNSRAALLTVEDQLRGICGALGCGFLMVASPEGKALVGVIEGGVTVRTMEAKGFVAPPEGLLELAGLVYRVTSVPIDSGRENIATLLVGEVFDVDRLSTAIMVFRDGQPALARLHGVDAAEFGPLRGACSGTAECEIEVRGKKYLAMKLGGTYASNGFEVYSVQSLDRAVAPLRAKLRWMFLLAAAVTLLGKAAVGALSTRAIVRPIDGLIAYLRQTESTGMLPVVGAPSSGIREIKELTGAFQRAAVSIRDSRERLDLAYVEFVGSLASALDARDRYTAGHSTRVSEYACAIARSMGLTAAEEARLKVGALLHDIGKIGVPDAVLQKPGRLTAEEEALIRQHPEIGRQILEGVNGFQPYLDIVELHHENWDGSGYPKGQRRTETPLEVRIVHVADAYDAMTSDRPYRRGMMGARAREILCENAGTQFDPGVVEVFRGVLEERETAAAGMPECLASADAHAMARALEITNAI